MTDFEKLIRVLYKGRVDCIVIGGLAATIHGSARLTQDVDVCYSREGGNLERLAKALKPLEPYPRGAPPGLPFQWSVTTLRAGLNFNLTTSVGALDLIGDVAGGGTYEELLPHTVVVTLFGYDVKCLNLEWLIKTKRAAGRIRDLEAAAELEALREERESGRS